MSSIGNMIKKNLDEPTLVALVALITAGVHTTMFCVPPGPVEICGRVASDIFRISAAQGLGFQV